MNEFLSKYKSVLTTLSWVFAGLIIAIDPKHIDKFAEAHPQWTGLIMAAWASLMAWANKIKATEPQGPQPIPPDSQKQQYSSQSGGTRRV